MPRVFIAFAFLAIFSWFLTPFGARAQKRAQTYEKQRTDLVLREFGQIPEKNAEGRKIAFVQVVRNDVFVPGETWPTWPNLFHWLTKREVIDRELLFRAGQPYREQEIQETMRNLRGLGIFSLVSITPVKTGDPSTVGVVVYTRDLWSLRLDSGFQFTGNRFDYAVLQLTERNLLGRGKTAAPRFILQPLTFRVGEVYIDRRLFGSDLSLTENVDVIFKRNNGAAEGSLGTLIFGRPFYDLSQRWSYSLAASYADQIWRDEKDGKVETVDIPDTSGIVKKVPRVFDDRWLNVIATGLYRRGQNYKQTFSGGIGLRVREVKANRETKLQPGQERVFGREVLPHTRRELFPFIGYELYLPRFVVMENLVTFGLSEHIRIGPNAKVGVELPLRAFGSSSDSFIPSGEFRYVWAGSNAMGEGALKPSARLENGKVVDQFISGQLRGATPHLLLGRLVLRGDWEVRRNDTGNVLVTLGGDNGLRGYPSRHVRKPSGNLMRGNFEYRTLPLQWQSVHVGAVLFYDIGTVYRSVKNLDLYSSVGVGLRLLFPQLNYYAFRFDFGIPIDSKGARVLVSFGRGQAVPLTAAEEVVSF